MISRVRGKLQVREQMLLVAAGSMAFSILAIGQTNASTKQDERAKAPEYDVVSVKQSKQCLGMSVGSGGDRFSARCVTVWGLIYNAYDVRPSVPIPGLPGWANSTPFDVEAKMDEDTFAALQKLPMGQQNEQSQLMLQSILADRFKLRVHHETIDCPIYALVVAKGKFKLKELPESEIPHGSSWGPGQIDVRGGPIKDFVFCLSDTLGRVVVDRTGLKGKYDIALKWTPDELRGTPDAGPSIFTALQEQLGLKLARTKGPVDILVVDHVEMPSAN